MMSKKDEAISTERALKLALETFQSMNHEDSIFAGEYDDEIAAIREALAEQPAQQGPVAYDKTEINCFAQDLYDQKMREGKRGHYESMFHVIHQCIKKVSPPAQQGQVAWTLLLTGEHHGLVGKAGEKFVGHPEHYERVDVYTSPQRTWVGLTDEEMDDCWNKLFGTGNYNRRNVYRAIEAKLRSKNENRN